MKRLITLFCVVITVCSLMITAFAASGVSVSLSSSAKSINAGDKVTITVSAKATGCSSGGVEVSFDSAIFELVSGDCVVSGAFMKDFNVKSKDGVFAFDSASNISGKVLKFTLKAKSDVPTGKSNVTVKFKADSTTVSSTTSVTIACDHTYSDNCDTTCNKCQATRKVNHKWGNASVVKKADCKSAGTAKYTCTVCGETKTEATKKASHTYDNNCDANCNVCDKKREVKHEFAWCGNETEHWEECTACGFQTEKASHTLASEMTADEVGHGYACSVCKLIPQPEEHAYDSSCDDSCGGCGYIRQVSHPHSGIYSVDKDSHWYICALCGEAVNKGEHTPGPAATETTDQICTQCCYMITLADNHTHIKLDEYESDETNHWYTCLCGEVQSVPHTWDNGTVDEEKGLTTYVCADCGEKKVEAYEPEFVLTFENLMAELEESPAMQILALALCGSVVIVLILLIVNIVLSSKYKRLKKRLS